MRHRGGLHLWRRVVLAYVITIQPFGLLAQSASFLSTESGDGAPSQSAPHPTIAVPKNATSASFPVRIGKNPGQEEALPPTGRTSDLVGADSHTSKPLGPSATAAVVAKSPRSAAVFIENRGQWDSKAKFQFRAGTKTLWLTDDGIRLDNVRLHGSRTSSAAPPSARTINRPTTDPAADRVPADAQRLVFTEQFIGANTQRLEGIDPQNTRYNYLLAGDPSSWHTNVRSYAGVIYRDLWPGVDFRIFGHDSDIEQEFVVHPGADIRRVQVAYRGIDSLAVAADGSLGILTGFGELHESKPTIYQEQDHHRVPVEGRFKVVGTTYTFDVGPYDPTSTLLIDPTLLYSTYLGGSSSSDDARGIAVDGSGNVFVTGLTLSTDFPTTPGSFEPTAASAGCCGQLSGYVAKLDPLGSSLIYATYISGLPYGIAVDAAGEAYVAGSAHSNMPRTANASQAGCGDGNQVAFFSKLTSKGDALLYSTCLGSGAYDHFHGLQTDRTSIARGIAIDDVGRAYITGAASCSCGPLEFPTTPGAFRTDAQFGASFVAVIDPSLVGSASLVYSTYLGDGGCGGPGATSVAVDDFGMIYVVGTAGAAFPVTPGALLTTFPVTEENCRQDFGFTIYTGFVAKLNPQAAGASSLVYATFLGGSRAAVAESVAVDSTGSAYVVGTTGTGSVPFPTTAGAYQPTPRTVISGPNAFVTKLNPQGSALVYSTLLGGSQATGLRGQAAQGIALDSLGNAYVTGFTASSDFPTTPNAFQPSHQGGFGALNAFVTKLNPTGSALIYSSYLGGGAGDEGLGIAVDALGDAYVAGFTGSPGFPVTPFAFQPILRGTGDAFIAKFPLGSLGNLSITGISPSVGGNTGSVTATAIGSGFQAGASMKLVCVGQSDILAANVSVRADGRAVSGTFALLGTNPGACNVVVANANGTSVTDAGGFSIQQGGSATMWIDIVGLHSQRGGTAQNYFVVYGNRGTIDSSDIVLSIEVPTTVMWSESGPAPLYQVQLDASTLKVFKVSAVPPHGSRAFVVTLIMPYLGTDTGLPFELHAWIDPR